MVRKKYIENFWNFPEHVENPNEKKKNPNVNKFLSYEKKKQVLEVKKKCSKENEKLFKLLWIFAIYVRKKGKLNFVSWEKVCERMKKIICQVKIVNYLKWKWKQQNMKMKLKTRKSQ